jgi:glyoxylase-like metal-dependent hydrolase (beta-lactamase superfamily II)
VSEKQEKQEAQTEVVEVAPGVLRIQLPIMLPGLGHVNCYVLEDERGVALIDPGLPDPAQFSTLESRLASIGVPISRVHTVVITHSHPDHFGGAGRFRLMNDAEVVAHRSFRTIFDPHDAETLELMDARAPRVDDDGFDPARFADYLMTDDQIPDLPGRVTPWGGRMPFPPKEHIEAMRAWDDLTKRGFIGAQPTRRLDEADVIRLGRRDWVAVHTPGHTADHLCLWDPNDGILFSGDHVLPTITPHISGLGPTDDSLADYLDALDHVAELPRVQHVLPAHGLAFTDLPQRTAAIRRHHLERLDMLAEIASQIGPNDVVEFSHHLFQVRSWGPMAESETYAHLEHLVQIGEATVATSEGTPIYTVTRRPETPPLNNQLTGLPTG